MCEWIPGFTRDHQGAGSLGFGKSDARWVPHQGAHLAVRLDVEKPVLDAVQCVETHRGPGIALWRAGVLGTGLSLETAPVRCKAVAP